jgi:hypothetical protein
MVAPSGATGKYELKLNIGLAAISLLPNAGRWSGRIEVSLVQRDRSGNVYDPLSQTVGLNLTQDSYDKAAASGMPYVLSFTPNAKASSLRAIVRDLGSGSVGTLTIPL